MRSRRRPRADQHARHRGAIIFWQRSTEEAPARLSQLGHHKETRGDALLIHPNGRKSPRHGHCPGRASRAGPGPVGWVVDGWGLVWAAELRGEDILVTHVVLVEPVWC